ncbi:PaaI family thioesterase [Phytohabitans rumicis]|uniref:Acyl-coenzyme A thioesterase THEM4 n=1 Tax=Phytohabitans rumicis TaxID=1076125 RepID=A0A6V8LGR3_9ACTN|nr:PaaI family thioesterase [Phytohabitans rumicis]GFJ96443.1 thioesterase [Phytohabitans rumicis]
MTDSGRSYHTIGDPAEVEAETESLRDRRAAITELGDALRTLVEQAAATEAPADELRRAAALVREATIPVGKQQRERGQMPTADDLLGGVRMYNPVCGSGSALAPPLLIELGAGGVTGSCTLGLAYEGPPMYAHGGVSALLLDQILGYATSASGHPGMTVRLDTEYRAPVPLQTELRLSAEVVNVDGRKVTARATIATAAEPDRELVVATGLFIALRADQAIRLFGTVLHPDASNPAVAHD